MAGKTHTSNEGHRPHARQDVVHDADRLHRPAHRGPDGHDRGHRSDRRLLRPQEHRRWRLERRVRQPRHRDER
jgi:hypothetical protein